MALIIAMVMTKNAKGELPFTEEGYRRWRRSLAARVLAGLGALFCFLATLAMISDVGAGVAVPVLGFIGCIVVFVRLGKNVIFCRIITKESITLDLPSAAAGAALQERLHGGAAIATAKPATTIP
ncbi:MAG: hypothetical protein ACT4TC_11200 [Myxococcaceae bacterium]